MDPVWTVENLYRNLIAGDMGPVIGGFGAKATVDSPLGGKELPQEWIAETRAWLAKHEASTEPVNTVHADDRVAHEFVLHVTIDGARRDVPVMLIADIEDDAVRDLRVYHSTWPLTGSHSVRGPVMDYDLDERPAEPVGSYHGALAAGDAAAADAVFEPGGSVREPAGSQYTHAGDDRTAWYKSILADGPLVLRLGTITDDGDTVVYEYLVARWGSVDLPKQAGAAAYARGESGRLVSARIYDDVDPPVVVAT